MAVRTVGLALLWCLPALVCAPRARAQEVASGGARATILHIDGDDVVVDLGRAQVSEAQTLTVYRAIEVRHPLTQKKLRDRFAIGTLAITQAGDTLSIAHARGTPSHPFAVGDSVELAVSATTAPPATPTLPASQAPPTTTTGGATAQSVNGAPGAAASAIPAATKPTGVVTRLPAQAATAVAARATGPTNEERALAAAWYATLSKPPLERAAVYTDLLQRFQSSAYRAQITAEILYLRKLDAQMRERSGELVAQKLQNVSLAPITQASEGEAVELAGLVRNRAAVRSLLVHARPLERTDYETYAATIDDHGHARATLPATLAEAPGFAYFVEGVDEHGAVVPVLGSADAPRIASVRRKTHPAPPALRTTSVRFSSEIVSFDGVSGRDYYFSNEGDFLYRVRYGYLHGVRVGYGTYQGRGGTVQDLDRLKLPPQPAGFTYGFLETEFELMPLIGIAMRGTVGLGRPDDPASQRKGLTGGFQLRARVGQSDGTHLILAGELMPEIGQRAYIGLRFAPIERMPMAAEVVVTDQPVNANDLAVRLIYEIGYRMSPRLALALRPSYELRTITHAGPGIGITASFDW